MLLLINYYGKNLFISGSINTQKYERIMGRNENFHLKYKNTIEENTPVPQIQQVTTVS